MQEPPAQVAPATAVLLAGGEQVSNNNNEGGSNLNANEPEVQVLPTSSPVQAQQNPTDQDQNNN